MSSEYLVYIISDVSVPPKNVKQIRQFIDLAGYFRHFFPNFSREMIPLYELTKEGTRWTWTERHEAVRVKIIEYLIFASLLTIFQRGLQSELHADSSSIKYGAIFIPIKQGRQVVAYFSIMTTDAESRYHSYKLETLTVIRAIKHCCH